jgi:outer membrane cobalamin receptor
MRCIFSLVYFTLLLKPSVSLALEPESQEKRFDDYLDMSLQDLLKQKITVASKREQSVSDAPSVVSVLNRQQILAYGASNLGDLLEQMPAVYRGNLFSLHDAYVSVRGQAADGVDGRTLITLNGRPMREYWNNINQPVYRGMPIDAIERIEMIRGPGSVLYGSGAFSDVINIVTRDPETTSESLRLTAGSFDTQSGEFTTSYNGTRIKGLTTIKADRVGGWDYQRNDGTRYDSQDNGWDNTSIVSNWKAGDAGFEFFYSDIDADSIGPSGAWPGTTTSTTRLFLNAYYAQDISTHWNLRGDFTGNQTTEYVEDDLILKQDVRTHDFIYEVTARGDYTDWDFLSGFAVSRLFGHDRTKTQITIPFVGDFVSNNNNSGDTAWYNGYFQATYHANKNLDLILGAQANKPESIDINYSPRIGAIYQINSDWGMKILYGEAFRTASWSDSDSTLPPIFSGNPSLEPEEIATTDVQFFYRDTNLYLAWSAFRSEITNNYLTVNRTVTNAGEIVYTGGEFEWQWNASNSWGYEGSIAFQENEDDGDYNTRFTPQWLIKNGVTFNVDRRLRLAVFDNYVSKIDAPNNDTVNPGSEAVHILNLNAKYDISQWFDNGHGHALQLTVTNALEPDPLYQPDQAIKSNYPWRGGRAAYFTYTGEF